MSFSIDLRELTKDLVKIQHYINQFDTPGRFVVKRITAYATLTINVTPSPTLEAAVSQEGSDVWHQVQKALDWQPEHCSDRDELEVLHYLKLINGMNPYRTQYAGEATTVTSSLHGSAGADDFDDEQALPLSSFRRHLWRCTLWERPTHASCRYYTIQRCSDDLCRQVLGQKPCSWASYLDSSKCSTLVMPRHPDASVRRAENWVLELDVVDRYSPNYTHTWKCPFLETSHRKDRPWPNAAQGRSSRVPVKRFHGTRYRVDRKRWLAETRVPNHKHKISFGTFKSEEEAARAVDAAFHYYNKPHRINFPDSQVQMPPAPREACASETEKLHFVKEQAQRMATLAFASREPPPAVGQQQYPIKRDYPVDFLGNSQPGFSAGEHCCAEAPRFRTHAVQITDVGTEGDEEDDGVKTSVAAMTRRLEFESELPLQLQQNPVRWSDESSLSVSTGSPGLGFRVSVDLPSLSDDCFDCLPDDPFLQVSELV